MTLFTDSAINARKLTIAEMERLGPEHFDMADWYDTTDVGFDLSQIDFRLAQQLDSCDTTACLAGTAKAVAALHNIEMTPVMELGIIGLISSSPRMIDHQETVAAWLGISSRWFHVSSYDNVYDHEMIITMLSDANAGIDVDYHTSPDGGEISYLEKVRSNALDWATRFGVEDQ